LYAINNSALYFPGVEVNRDHDNLKGSRFDSLTILINQMIQFPERVALKALQTSLGLIYIGEV
jgi:hypothetical protein